MIIGIRNYSTIPTFRLAKTQLCLLEEAAIGLCKILPGGPNVTLPDKPRTPSTVVDQVSKKKPNIYIYRGCTTLTQAHLSDAEDLWPCCCLINHRWGMVGSVKFLLESPEIGSQFVATETCTCSISMGNMFFLLILVSLKLPSGKHTKSYWKWPSRNTWFPP